MGILFRTIRIAGTTAAVVLLAGHAVPVHSQAATAAAIAPPAAVIRSDVASFAHQRYRVFIDLDERVLEFRQGDLTLWSAPVGIGSGIHLISDRGDWDFSTPPGEYQVEFMERDPVWIAPDWFFIENNLPVPPWDDPSRRIPGGLGAAAIYFHPTLAIHGTAGPGVGVSHGCVRLLDRYAKRLYHNVQVGTEVIIVGGEAARENPRVVDIRGGYDPSIAPVSAGPPPPDPAFERWGAMPTSELLQELDEQLALSPAEGRWDEPAVLLLQRARTDDDSALAGLIVRANDLPSLRIEREWATFLADAYRRAPARTLEALAALPPAARQRVALLIVSATLAHFEGDLSDPTVPWPSRRIPDSLVTAAGLSGWEALLTAESTVRGLERVGD